jgi:hypothetical protein
MRRRGGVSLAFAVLLTVAAGLSLAEEHAWVPATPGTAMSPDVSRRSAPGEATAIPRLETGGVHGRRQAGHNPGVGSRALTGHEAQEPAAAGGGPN